MVRIFPDYHRKPAHWYVSGRMNRKWITYEIWAIFWNSTVALFKKLQSKFVSANIICCANKIYLFSLLFVHIFHCNWCKTYQTRFVRIWRCWKIPKNRQSSRFFAATKFLADDAYACVALAGSAWKRKSGTTHERVFSFLADCSATDDDNT